MQEKNLQNSDIYINRLCQVFKMKDDTDLSIYLGVSNKTVSGWRTRGSFNFTKVLEKCEGVNLHWLFTGEGSMFANNEAGRALRALHHPDEPEIIGNASHILAKPVITEDELAVIKALIQRLEKSD